MDIPAITPKLRWLGIAVLAAACLWITFGAKSCVGQHQVAVHGVEVASQIRPARNLLQAHHMPGV